MDHIESNIEEILDRQINGFHQYLLSPFVCLNYVSRNLCDMLGFSKEEWTDSREDPYLQQVYPSDREKYCSFLEDIRSDQQTSAAEYRLVKKDGTLIWVRDTVTIGRLEDGSMIANSVLTDITDLKNNNNDLPLFMDRIPCGFLRFSCEKQPRITYINQKMIELLRFPEEKDGEMNDLEMFTNNIFLMMPMEERRRFSKYLNRVYSSEVPIAGTITLLRCDGSRAHVFGWVTKCVNEEGKEEFQSVCMDITEHFQAQQTSENKRYLQALADIYDKIFEFNLAADTVTCLHSEEASFFKRFENVPMKTGDAVDHWLTASAAKEQQDELRHFFMDHIQKNENEIDAEPPQITYQARSTYGAIRQYRGIFIRADENRSFFCCREIKETGKADWLKAENDRLKGEMRDLIRQFSDGIAAFEISPEGLVKPLYATENVCEFFGYTEEEWISLTECYTPLETFTSHSEASCEKYLELLRRGEAEFSYFDYQSETERRIKAVCSAKEPGSHTSRYIMLYTMEEPAKPAGHLPQARTVSVRTFGYFDVFVGNTPIVFRNKKARELLALLIDRRGGYLSSEEAISFLWEDEPVNTLTLSRYRKVALRLKNTLEEYGIAEIVESVDGKRRIAADKIVCDLYQYLSGKEEYTQLFMGSYLTNYSWGEMTLGELLSQNSNKQSERAANSNRNK